ncbi:Transcription initiation factor TFIID subunit 9 [Exophiala xenobiotica]|uniref:Transcription initiation factor TFIID subunit 9 n=1 Tax=Lithohypha guttulata TaxID=1690604 RepID=A0ABR0K000_9EURO|nr:Transcription initiation factor TFIID subunit 9 [Lithohypha guttulata]KAK5312991.1 Transcription initiation factor TFIID subunit 9 [Exophiala xenobiotica]
MASPAEPAHPLTPPAESTQPTTQTQTQSQPASSQQDTAAKVEALLSEPLTSLHDDGTSKRPRDHRLIHLLLSAYGISAYQERVPLQLMDFAYRYTSAVLSDALHIQNEGYDLADSGNTTTGSKGRGRNKNNEEGDISLAALRMSIQSRLGYQFSGSLPKEFLKQLADEKNRIALGPAVRETGSDKVGPLIGGVRLPHERHCLTGMGWGLKDEWESEGEESVEENGVQRQAGDEGMQVDGEEEMGEDEDEEGAGRMEDVFGDEGGGGGSGDGDTEMQI